MDLGLKDRVALVMASSTGIGRAIAATLAAEGARVAICARDRERLERTAREIGAVCAIPVDLEREGAAAGLVAKVREELGEVEILVTNAGGPPAGAFDEISIEQWKQGYQSLWLCVVEALHAVLPGMRERGWGRILLVTSAAATEPIPRLTISNGLRAGLNGLVNSVSKEVAANGVTINALLPGFTDTDRLRQLGSALDPLIQGIPAGRLGAPEELGALAAFLASERAGYLTGQAFVIDGGRAASI